MYCSDETSQISPRWFCLGLVPFCRVVVCWIWVLDFIAGFMLACCCLSWSAIGFFWAGWPSELLVFLAACWVVAGPGLDGGWGWVWSGMLQLLLGLVLAGQRLGCCRFLCWFALAVYLQVFLNLCDCRLLCLWFVALWIVAPISAHTCLRVV